MPKRARELSARTVATLKGDGRHAVGGVVGLYLRIKGGSRSWILRIKTSGRRPELGLGSFPEVSLAMARERAWDRRRAKANGPGSDTPAAAPVRAEGAQEPQDAAQTGTHRAPEAPPSQPLVAANVKTFEFCARTYVAAQEPAWKSKKHAKQWLSTLEHYAFPVIGALAASEVNTEHVLQILKPIWCEKTETATRLRGRIEAILDWAKHKGYRTGDNPARWEENLKHELPSPTKLKKRKKQHHPALPYMRVGAFMADLRSRQGVSIKALEWGILTAARSQEIRGARRSEVDVALKRWTIPAERMKMEIDHVVPLSEAALALFNDLPAGDANDLLFPAPEGGELSDAAFGAIIDGMHEADVRRGGTGYVDIRQNRIATQHGFRSTFRDWAAEVTLFPKDIVEHALAHKLKDEAEAAYQRGEMLLKRAIVMEKWAQFCADESPMMPNLLELMDKRAA